ncbi:MAG: hypothetical protein IT445_06870 [Phycisphaeraceae bacterium]|nr:hypothetical protein [Phycisphaeraceae bacterium]
MIAAATRITPRDLRRAIISYTLAAEAFERARDDDDDVDRLAERFKESERHLRRLAKRIIVRRN